MTGAQRVSRLEHPQPFLILDLPGIVDEVWDGPRTQPNACVLSSVMEASPFGCWAHLLSLHTAWPVRDHILIRSWFQLPEEENWKLHAVKGPVLSHLVLPAQEPLGLSSCIPASPAELSAPDCDMDVPEPIDTHILVGRLLRTNCIRSNADQVLCTGGLVGWERQWPALNTSFLLKPSTFS